MYCSVFSGSEKRDRTVLSVYCKQQTVQLYFECMIISPKSLQQQDIHRIFRITAFHSRDFNLIVTRDTHWWTLCESRWHQKSSVAMSITCSWPVTIFALKKTSAFRSKWRQGFQPVSSRYRRTLYRSYNSQLRNPCFTSIITDLLICMLLVVFSSLQSLETNSRNSFPS